MGGGLNIDRSSGVSCKGGLGGGTEGGSRVEKSTAEYGSPKNAEGRATCPGEGGINCGGGGGGAVEGGGGIRICRSLRSSTEIAPSFDRLSVSPVHGGNSIRYSSTHQVTVGLLSSSSCVKVC